jgi:ribulose 1,5-bisphosphate synthetase/thiazole synthase
MNEAYQSVTHQVIENKRRKFDKVNAADINIVTTGSEALLSAKEAS